MFLQGVVLEDWCYICMMNINLHQIVCLVFQSDKLKKIKQSKPNCPKVICLHSHVDFTNDHIEHKTEEKY